MTAASQIQPLLIFVRDLIFSSRIVSAAKEAGLPFRVVRDISVLATLEGRALIVDLNEDGFLDAAKIWKQRVTKPVIGFVAHVDVDRIAAAREAAFDRVLTRGQFTASLEEIVAGLATTQR